VVLREVKHMEGSFEELRRAGAPDQGSGAYADVDTTSQMFAVGDAAAGAGYHSPSAVPTRGALPTRGAHQRCPGPVACVPTTHASPRVLIAPSAGIGTHRPEEDGAAQAGAPSRPTCLSWSWVLGPVLAGRGVLEPVRPAQAVPQTCKQLN